MFTKKELEELKAFDRTFERKSDAAINDRMDAIAKAMAKPGYRFKTTGTAESAVATATATEKTYSLMATYAAVGEYRRTCYGTAYGDNKGYHGLI